MRTISPMRLSAVAHKEFLHVLRDPWSLGLGIFIPAIMLILFGYALTLDVDRVPMVVWDQSGTQLSRDFVDSFGGSRYFSVRGYVDGYEPIERAIDRGDALVGMVIPRGFAGEISTGNDAPVQMIFDASDSNTATIAINYASALTQAFSRKVTVAQFQRSGGKAPDPPIDLRQRVWFNADMESRDAIVPGLIAISMMIIAALLTSLTVAREWERGTMEQLISTPIKGPELILGKLAPYFTIGMLDMLMVVLMGYYIFGVPLRGDLVLLFASSAIFLIGVLGMGILISTATRSQLLSSQLAMLATFLPAFLLSGFMYPIENMPHAIQVITYLIPARYFVELLRAIYLKGVGLDVLWFQFSVLSVFAFAMVFLSNKKFRKKLE